MRAEGHELATGGDDVHTARRQLNRGRSRTLLASVDKDALRGLAHPDKRRRAKDGDREFPRAGGFSGVKDIYVDPDHLAAQDPMPWPGYCSTQRSIWEPLAGFTQWGTAGIFSPG
jgi:hypothetical protein